MQKSNTTPVIGERFPGGYFAGVLVIDGQRFGIIMSKKAGEIAAKIGTYGIDVNGSSSSWNGAENTQALANAGSDVAKQILALEIDGVGGCHIPARDQQELLYRNFKPTTRPNYVGLRSGENTYSAPIGHEYTATSPGQTTVEALQDGAPDALANDWHWTSTQYSSVNAWSQISDGNQGWYFKDFTGRVRAVRMIQLDDLTI